MRAAESDNYKRGWFGRRARRLNQRRFVFVDEAAVNTAMTRRYGRAPKGGRAHDSAPRNYGTRNPVSGAMGLRGLAATLTVEGAVDAEVFNAYAEEVLGPRLRRGGVVVLDDLGAHRASRIEEVAETRGAQALRLAPYSPDFSPVAQCRSKIKSYLRGAKARTRERLEEALAAALGLVTKTDICGSVSPQTLSVLGVLGRARQSQQPARFLHVATPQLAVQPLQQGGRVIGVELSEKLLYMNATGVDR